MAAIIYKRPSNAHILRSVRRLIFLIRGSLPFRRLSSSTDSVCSSACLESCLKGESASAGLMRWVMLTGEIVMLQAVLAIRCAERAFRCAACCRLIPSTPDPATRQTGYPLAFPMGSACPSDCAHVSPQPHVLSRFQYFHVARSSFSWKWACGEWALGRNPSIDVVESATHVESLFARENILRRTLEHTRNRR